MQETSLEARERLDKDAWVEIDLNALTHNIKILRQKLQPGTQFAAVVKKNAYGHGAVSIARFLASSGIDYLCVYSLEEGLELRRANINVPILVFGFIPLERVKEAICSQLTPTVMDSNSAIAFDNAAKELGTTISIHMKVDTGLNRSGVSLEDAGDFLRFLSNLGSLKIDGLYTHFSSADELDPTQTEIQLKKFLTLANTSPEVKMLHAANSAATLRFPKTHLNLVRVGLALYGLYPFESIEKNVVLRPILSFKARITRIHHLRAGDGVGYGLTWKAQRDACIALVAVGYGDGLPRILSNRGEALIGGYHVPIRGNISMDQCVLDITNVPETKVGDIVVFIGRQGLEDITADAVARLANTINYEIVTSISPRLPRIYL